MTLIRQKAAVYTYLGMCYIQMVQYQMRALHEFTNVSCLIYKLLFIA